MNKIIEQKKRELSTLKRFFNIMGVKPLHIILPVIISFVMVSFGGAGIALLLPLVKGVADNNYSFIKNVPVLNKAISIFPKFSPEFMSENMATFLFLSILIFIAMLLRHSLWYLSNVLTAYWNGKFSKRIKTFIFKRFLSFGKLYFDRISQGYVNTIITYSGDVLKLLNLIQDTVREGFDIIIHFIIMIIISWKLSIFSIIVFPILHFSLKHIVKKITKLSEKQNIAHIATSKKVFNMLSSIPLIKAYAKEDQMNEIYRQQVENLRILEFKRSKVECLATPIQNIIILTALLLMVAFVAFLSGTERQSEIAVFIVFFYVAREALPKFSIFNKARIALAGMRAPIGELTGILANKNKSFVAEGTREFKGLSSNIGIKNLNFSYIKEKPVLENINLLIEKGKMTAIVGPTGAGKTTLVSLIMRFYDCSSGAIKIDGHDIREFKIKTLRDHVSIVTQDIFLFNDTLRYNITFAASGRAPEEKIIDIVKKARLYDFIMSLPGGLETEVGDRGIRLSGGEKQRVAIARALLRGTEILVLDEATSSLDTKTEKLIQQSIDEAVKGRTTIVIAHRLSTIKNADKIVVLENGKIAEEGSLNGLLERKGKFYQYWQEQKFY